METGPRRPYWRGGKREAKTALGEALGERQAAVGITQFSGESTQTPPKAVAIFEGRPRSARSPHLIALEGRRDDPLGCLDCG